MIARNIYPLVFCLLLSFFSLGQEVPCAYDQVQHHLMTQNPDYQVEVAHYIHETLPRIAQTEASRLPAVITIPVVVHVIHTGQAVGNGPNLSTERINSQIDILNQDYRRTNDDVDNTPSVYQDLAADTEIQFCLATVDPDGGITNGITRHVYSDVPDIDYIENTIKPATNWDPSSYLNIWTIEVPGNSVIGYSYLPTPTIVGFPKDGVVINYPNFGYIDAENRGRTCVHEVGHYLGLQHTWGVADANGDPVGCSSDDGIEDTPNCDGPHYGCPSFGGTSCSSVDMIMNYMEYVNDDCMNLFTNGQKNVMQATLGDIRSSLANSAVTLCDAIDESCRDLTLSSLEMGFEAGELLNGWVIENVNNDIRTWLLTQTSTTDWGPNNGSGLAVYLWNTNGTTTADDYLFTRCFEVTNGHTYKLTFSYACAEDNNGIYNEAFEVGFSEQQSAADFMVINDDWIFENVNNPYPDYNDKTLYYEPDFSGSTSIGFHVFSEADRYALQIDDIRIEDLGQNSLVADLSGKNSLAAIPNPSDGVFTLNLDFEKSQESVEIGIYDVTGRLIRAKTMQNVLNESLLFDLSEVEAGLYFVKVQSEQIMLTERVILSK